MTDTTSTPLPRRGNSRGGLGKYLRARGRRGYGRPAEFTQRLVLEDEMHDEEDEEFKAQQTQKYSKRQLANNADRYAEQEPELDSDGMSVRVWNFQLTLVTGEPIVEPEVDLSAFLEKQRLADDSVQADEDEEDDVDHNLDNFPTSTGQIASKKGKVEQIEWTQELEQLAKDKASAEANWGTRHFHCGHLLIS